MFLKQQTHFLQIQSSITPSHLLQLKLNSSSLNVLKGKSLHKGCLHIRDWLENGNVSQTKKNAADGSITFDAIEYNAVGKHPYTVREKKLERIQTSTTIQWLQS